MFGPDEGMVEKARLFLGQDEDPACAVGESLERGSSLSREMSADRVTRAQSSMAYVTVTATVLVISPGSTGIDAALDMASALGPNL